MPYDQSLLRFERFQIEAAYHSAYNYWNLPGVLAERHAHGPTFGAAHIERNQTTLSPQVGRSVDARLWAVYGLKASGLNAEGETWVTKGREIAEEWMNDCFTVLQPKRTVRLNVSIFALYPVDDAVTASRKLRVTFYNDERLRQVLPEDLREERDRFHAALDFLAKNDEFGSGVSVVLGAVGPTHAGTFFMTADPERDGRWWMGIRYDRKWNDPEGHKTPVARLNKMVRIGFEEVEQIAGNVLGEVIE